MRWRRLAALLALALGCAACRDDPATVVGAARDALAAQDDEAFLELCEPRAAAFLREASAVQKRSGRLLKVLRDGRPTPSLLPKGEIGEVVEAGHRALVVVRQGERKEQVPLRLIRGKWRLDLLETEQLLAAMRPGPR